MENLKKYERKFEEKGIGGDFYSITKDSIVDAFRLLLTDLGASNVQSSGDSIFFDGKGISAREFENILSRKYNLPVDVR